MNHGLLLSNVTLLLPESRSKPLSVHYPLSQKCLIFADAEHSQELKKILPRTELFEIGNKKIGLVHGSGGPWGIAERVRELFIDVDVIIFGHSHTPCNRYIRGTLMFNPGQASNSFGLLTIDDGIKSEIMRV